MQCPIRHVNDNPYGLVYVVWEGGMSWSVEQSGCLGDGRAIGDVRWEDRENRNVASEYRFCRSKGKMMQPRYMQSTPNNEYSRRIPEVVTENENERVCE